MPTSLRDLRQQRGWTLEQLATRVHLSVGAISMIERGERNPTYRTRRDLAEALGVAIEAIEWPEGDEGGGRD